MVMTMVMNMFVLMAFFRTATACCTHNLFYLQFFYPQFLAGKDVSLMSAAGGTFFVIGPYGKFSGAFPAIRLARRAINNQPRSIKQGILRAGLEAEFNRIGQDIAERAYLHNYREYSLAGGSALTYFHDTLDY
jgi:hypothetical protein